MDKHEISKDQIDLINQYECEMPLIKAIPIIVEIKRSKILKKQKAPLSKLLFAIIISGAVFVTFNIRRLLKKLNQYNSTLKQLQSSQEIQCSTIRPLIERWSNNEDVLYNSLDILQSNWDGRSVMRGVFISTYSNANMQLIGLIQSEDNLVQVNNNTIKPTALSIPTTSAYADLPQCGKKIRSVLPIDFEEFNVKSNFLQRMGFIFTRLFNTLFRQSVLKSPQIFFAEGMVNIHIGMPLCFFCDVVSTSHGVRLKNIKWVGKSFRILRSAMMKHFNERASEIKFKLGLLLLGGCALAAYFLNLKYNQNTLHLWSLGMEERYPRILEVKKFPRKVIINREFNDSLKCAQCRVNQREMIYIPCYHFELCRECYSSHQNLIICWGCKKQVFCALQVYLS